ncbi:hypothetical protein LCGC14_1879320 [marine sediment metagenome]|uniref:DUF4878 domain-containing protein n=1 Tax=marine sediment metagenome TaxID=412755 RepID=A0A0F9G2S5_9ZZZZ
MFSSCYTRPLLGLVGLLVSVLGVLVVLALLLFFRGDPPVAGPREVFAAHIAALADGDWALSDSYAHDDCDFGDQALLDDVLASGFDFEEKFEVDDVWINEDGTLAIMSLADVQIVTEDAERALPMLQLVDGRWLLICAASWAN